MKPCLKQLPVLLFLILVTFGCNNSDSTKNQKIPQKTSQFIGTWQQTAIGKENVTGIVVKIIFSEHTLTMDAPGCMIIGDYTTEGNMLTYTVTAVQGERCSKQQMIGQSDRVHYIITDNRLTMTPLKAGKESQAVYRRIDNHASRP